MMKAIGWTQWVIVALLASGCASDQGRQPSLKEGAREVGTAVGTAAREVSNGAKKVGKTVGEAAREGGKAVKEAFTENE